MKKLLNFLMTGCWHKWKIRHAGNLLVNNQTTGAWIISICAKCGQKKIKERHIKRMDA